MRVGRKRMVGHQKPLLAIYDITGIQEYIFATRWMRENAGASLIVTRMLREVLPEIINEVTEKNCVTDWSGEGEGAKAFSLHLQSNLQVEIVYIGGGNAVVAYRNVSVYDEVNRCFAKALVEESYTLNLATAAVETDFQNYGRDKGELDKKLQAVKAAMLRQRPMGALPVVEQESFYGLPITWQDGTQKLSTLQRLKRQAYSAYDEKTIESVYHGKLPKGTAFAVEMKDLIAQEGEDAFVAVVHIDGNGMGEMVRGVVDHLKAYDSDVPKMRAFSRDIANCYQAVFAKLVEILLGQSEAPEAPEKSAQLPVRPLIMDGDDITFVCKGALGVPLAALFLRILAGKELWIPAEKGKKKVSLSACAGIALVHHNFPFDIAYEIAEECCRNAKKRRDERGDGAGYLDFHLTMGAYVESLRRLRAQENMASETECRMNRPYRVSKEDTSDAPDSFDCLHRSLVAMREYKNGDPVWPRSRLKRLYEAYLRGPAAVRILQEEFASRGYFLADLEGKKNKGTKQKNKEPKQKNERTKQKAYQVFDALELLELYDETVVDAYIKLKEQEAEQ